MEKFSPGDKCTFILCICLLAGYEDLTSSWTTVNKFKVRRWEIIFYCGMQQHKLWCFSVATTFIKLQFISKEPNNHLSFISNLYFNKWKYFKNFLQC